MMFVQAGRGSSRVRLAILICLVLTVRTHAADERVQTPPPCSCPLLEIVTIDSAHSLYYCDHFYSLCESDPEADYYYGHHDIPCFCTSHVYGECIADDRGREAFGGQNDPVSLDYILMLPAGTREHTRVLVDPTVPFIGFRDEHDQWRFAKMFVLVVDFEHWTKDAPWCTRYLNVAFETEAVPNALKTIQDCKPIQDGATGNHYVYRAHLPDSNESCLVILSNKHSKSTRKK
jgi:hypothetical protein